MTTKGEVYRLAQPAITSALELAVAERRLPAGEAVTHIDERMTGLVLACRAVSDAIDALDPGDVPKSWRRDPEGRRTA